MPYAHIPSPVKGWIPDFNPVLLGKEKPDATPFISGMYLHEGQVISDWGYVAYPSPSNTTSNLLAGTPMKIDSFTLKNGSNYLIAITTNNAYQYNSVTTTWDCITKGKTIADCETAWTASANVTSTADTSLVLLGTKSSKNVIGAGFTTGLVSYFNIGSLNLSTETGVHFWMYSTVATSLGDYQILLDDTAACVSPLESINLPAIAANTWTAIYVPYAVAGSDTAIISVGLKRINNTGPMTIYLDDVRSVDAFTGSSSNKFSTAVYNDTYLVTNGVNQPKKYLGFASVGMVNMTTTLNVGTITTAEIVLSFKDHILFFNTTENGAACPQRCTWSNIGQLEDFINGTAGYQDLSETEDWIVTALVRSEAEDLSEIAIFKEHTIAVCRWVGGLTPFRFDVRVHDKTIASKDAVARIDGVLHCVGTRDIYTYGGGKNVEYLSSRGVNMEDKEVKHAVFSSINYANLTKSFVCWDELFDQLQIYVPTTTTSPDTVYCYDYVDKCWFIKTRSVTCIGPYTAQTGVTIGQLTGTIGSQNVSYSSYLTKTKSQVFMVGEPTGGIFILDKTSYNNGSNAISSEFQTPDFILPTDYEAKFIRTCQLVFEAKGTSVTTQYSTDGGLTWNPTQIGTTNKVSLTSNYDFYQQDMDCVSRTIRFRFINTDLSSGFYLRYYGFYWHTRSGRR